MVINKLKNHFARYGIPDTIVSDGGCQYTSHEFAKFCKSWDIIHVTSSRSQNQQATYYNKRASDRQVLEEGDTVRLQPFRLGRKDWSRGTVVKRLDERSYGVDTPTGVLRRNRQHLKKTRERYEHQQAAVIPGPQILPSAREVTPAIDRPAQSASNNVPPGSPMRQPSAMTQSPERSDATTRSGRAIRLPARYRE